MDETVVQSYYAHNARKLRKMVDKLLVILHFNDVDKDDFYSLANEIFVKTMYDYDHERSFDAFLYSCLYKKFCSEMNYHTRDKRCMKVKVQETDENGSIVTKIKILKDERLDRPLKDDSDCTLGEIIESKISIESELLKEEENYSPKMTLYLSKLSSMQKDVLTLISIGFTHNEIVEELHITQKQLDNCLVAIYSPRNTMILI